MYEKQYLKKLTKILKNIDKLNFNAEILKKIYSQINNKNITNINFLKIEILLEKIGFLADEIAESEYLLNIKNYEEKVFKKLS